jgi:hypothetical protein
MWPSISAAFLSTIPQCASMRSVHVPEGAFLACNVPIVICKSQDQLTDLLFRALYIAELVDLQIELPTACTFSPGEHCDSHETLQVRHFLGQQGVYVKGRFRVGLLEY